ncbi:MAG TPA: NAD(+)/NADH kinase [Planctomycetota bacterium]|nr:NAD(+)/NADH kinase [Planctomycetota bacterium]
MLSFPAIEDVRRALVVSSRFKPEAHELARDLAARLERRGIEARLDVQGDRDLDGDAGGATLALAVGGDGTILNFARRLRGAAVPTVGINIGKLGFLAEFTAEEAVAYIEGGPAPFTLLPRLMLECRISGREGCLLALNDAVITQGPMARILAIEMAVDGGPATLYVADGVIVSTPVGSTAYSLSLGGPILTPGADAMLVTPIAPHSLTANRPLLLEGRSRLAFRVTRESPSLALVLDGQQMIPLAVGTEIQIARAGRPFLLAAHARRSFFDLLRAKFHWGEPPVYAPGR